MENIEFALQGRTYAADLSLLLIHESDIESDNRNGVIHGLSGILRFVCKVRDSANEDGPNTEAVNLLNALGRIVQESPQERFIVITTSYGGLVFSKAISLTASCNALKLPSAPDITYARLLKHVHSIFFLNITNENRYGPGDKIIPQHLYRLTGRKSGHIRSETIEAVSTSRGMWSRYLAKCCDDAGRGYVTINCSTLNPTDDCMFSVAIPIPSSLFLATKKLGCDVLFLKDLPFFAESKLWSMDEIDMVYSLARELSGYEEGPSSQEEGAIMTYNDRIATATSDETIVRGFLCPSRQTSRGRRALTEDFNSDRGSLMAPQPSTDLERVSPPPDESALSPRERVVPHGSNTAPVPVVIHTHASNISSGNLVVGASVGAVVSMSIQHAGEKTPGLALASSQESWYPRSLLRKLFGGMRFIYNHRLPGKGVTLVEKRSSTDVTVEKTEAKLNEKQALPLPKDRIETKDPNNKRTKTVIKDDEISVWMRDPANRELFIEFNEHMNEYLRDMFTDSRRDVFGVSRGDDLLKYLCKPLDEGEKEVQKEVRRIFHHQEFPSSLY